MKAKSINLTLSIVNHVLVLVCVLGVGRAHLTLKKQWKAIHANSSKTSLSLLDLESELHREARVAADQVRTLTQTCDELKASLREARAVEGGLTSAPRNQATHEPQAYDASAPVAATDIEGGLKQSE